MRTVLSEDNCARCSHATTERGPRAVPRRGSDCAAPRCARGSLRCSLREGGCDAARSGAERATASWLLAGPPPAAPDFPSLRCAPRRPRFAPTGYRPRAMRRSGCSSRNTSVVLAKPWSGVRRQRHCAALRSAERMAARAQRALQHLTRVDCPSATNEVSGASFDAGHAIEHRKGVGPQGRPPYTSAGAYPATALPRSVCAQ